jgi:PASTA domain-containing protein
MRIRLLALLTLAVVAVATSGARANHIPGATYNGTVTGGSSITFAVSGDGSGITTLSAPGPLQGNVCTFTNVGANYLTPLPITNHAFADTTPPITFSGSFSGAQSAQGTIRVNASGCDTGELAWTATTPANFTLSASPGSETTVQGGRATFAVAVAPQSGFAGSVSLGVTGLPAGASGSFSPPSIAGGSGSSTLTVATTKATPAGSYPFTITGRLDGLSHSAQATLVVTPAPCVVPNVKGKKLAAAKRALNARHCRTGRVSRAFSKRIKKGRVMAQSRRPGAQLKNGAKVNLVVSRGARRPRR